VFFSVLRRQHCGGNGSLLTGHVGAALHAEARTGDDRLTATNAARASSHVTGCQDAGKLSKKRENRSVPPSRTRLDVAAEFQGEEPGKDLGYLQAGSLDQFIEA
jgi:hypothetical protein